MWHNTSVCGNLINLRASRAADNPRRLRTGVTGNGPLTEVQ